MHRFGKILVRVVLVYFCLAFIVAGAGCVEKAAAKEWPVPNFGVFNVSQDVNVASIMDLLKLLEAEHRNKLPKDKIEAVGKDKKELLNNIDFGLYQLTLEEGNAFYQSGALFVKEKQPSSYSKQFLDGPPNISQKVNIIKFHDMMVREIDKFIAEFERYANKDSKLALTVKMLESPPLQFLEVGGNMAAATSMRVLFKYGDFMYPFYGKVYFFTVDGCLSAMVMLTSDSERLFWEPRFDEMIKTLEIKQN